MSDECRAKDLHEKWISFFNKTERKRLSGNKNLFVILGHLAHLERVFSMLSSRWTKEQNALNVNTSKSSYFYKITCKELQNYVKRDEKLLEKAKTEVKKNDTDDQIQRTLQ